MDSKPRHIWMTFVCLVSLYLCFCTFVHSQESIPTSDDPSAARVEKLSQAGPTLIVLLNHHKVLPKGSKNSGQLAQEIFEMLGGKLELQVAPHVEDMKEIDLVELMRQKDGSLRDLTLLYAAFLQTCEIPTAVLGDERTWLLLFQSDAKQPHTVQWNKEAWGVVALPTEKWGKFAEAQQKGEMLYRQLQTARRLGAISVYSHWRWDLVETVETLLRRGIEAGQRGEFEAAQKYFSSVLNMDAKNAAAINNLGNLDLFNEDMDAAFQRYKEALKLNGNDPAIYLNLGVASYQKWKSATEKKQKRVLEKQYQDAFDEAYRSVRNGLDLCRYLGVDPEDVADKEYNKSSLIYW